MKFLARKKIPPRLFVYFLKTLTRADYLSRYTELYLPDKRNLVWLRKLIAEYPNQFNTTLDTLSKIPDFDPAKHSQDLFEGLHDLGALTPLIFKRYRQKDAQGKKEFAEKIKKLKPRLFKNEPIKEILQDQDREVFDELVYNAYRPANNSMSFEQVQALINQLRDQTEDLADYRFPANGYEFNLALQEKITLKPGAQLDHKRLNLLREVLSNKYPKSKEDIKELSKLLRTVAKAGTTYTPAETSGLLSLFGQDEMVTNLLKEYRSFNKTKDLQKLYNYLSQTSEILGVYFKDNYVERLTNFLGANPTSAGLLAKLLTNPKRQTTLKKQMGKALEDVDWTKIHQHKEIAKLLNRVINSRVIAPLRKQIRQEFKKFQTLAGQEVSAPQQHLRAYISKNIGSFFAKAAAGICTDEDISLFNRDDHFHINVVEDEQRVQGNIQAYLITVNNEPALLLRGFNPSENLLKRINVPAFVEKVLDIGQRFVKDNKLTGGFYITDQEGRYHALSNRDQVSDYFNNKYLGTLESTPYSFRIAANRTISTIYKVPVKRG